MEVEQVTPLTYWHHHVVFETAVRYTGSSWSNELEKEEFATLTSQRSRLAVSAHHQHKQADVKPTRVARSRSSPDRYSRGDSSRPRRPSSPSAPALRHPLPTAPANLSPLLYNLSNNGFVAFYSPRPPATPLFLVHLPYFAPSSEQGTKIAHPSELQTKVKFQDKEEKKPKKFKSKESKKVIRYVMKTLLRGVYAGSASRAHAPEESSEVISRAHVEDIPPAKVVSASPLFHNVASQTKTKTSFIRPTADADMDDLSISSEERCTELDVSCECVGHVRALRDSHVRLMLRQMQQLRNIERLDRTLQRAHVASSPVQSPPTASAAHSAC